MSNWQSTRSEIKFLDNIGTHGEVPGDPLKLLKGYLKGAEARTNWGGIDKEKVIAHAKARIRELERGGAKSAGGSTNR